MNVEEIKKTADEKLKDLDVALNKNPHIQKISEQTKVRPSFLALGIGFLLVIVFVAVAGVAALANLIGFAYPAVASFQTLQGRPDDNRQWLTYWVIFALFALLESFPEEAFKWIPLYYFIKIGALVWAQLPQTRGAELVYNNGISKVLNRGEAAPAEAKSADKFAESSAAAQE